VRAEPDLVRANSPVAVHVEVNDEGARIAMVALYGLGLTEQRTVVSTPGGGALVRLRALAPAGCRGRVIARVYVTATTSDRALTRATTFVVGCASARAASKRLAKP
jgi:hypothetical protein